MKKTILLIIIIITNFSIFAQIQIRGFLKDSESGEKLIGASVIEKGTNNGTFSDNNGYFSIKTNKTATLTFSYVGYISKNIFASDGEDIILNVQLTAGKQLEEVIIKPSEINKHNISSISSVEIKNLPTLMGKPDVLKALQTRPGIQTMNEGTAMLVVRGGDPGQNLYLIDETPLVYVNHLGGFTSVFTPEMINRIDVYKSSFPSKYGGKLSSIIAITQNEGNKQQVQGTFSIGLTDASFTLEGPLTEKMTFFTSGRKTMTEPLMYLISSYAEGDYRVMYGFHDFNSKLSWMPDLKNSIHLSFYQGDDYLIFRTKLSESGYGSNNITNIWGNWLGALKWNRVFDKNAFISNSLSYSRYRVKNRRLYKFKNENGNNRHKTEYLSSINDTRFKSELKYDLLKNYKLSFGLENSYKTFVPSAVNKSESDFENISEQYNSNELSMFFNNKISYGIISAKLGGRFTSFLNNGFLCNSFEPRININLDVSSSNIFYFDYTKSTQFAHLLITPGDVMSNEIWLPANERLKPSFSEQATISWIKQITKGMFSLETNLYFKKMKILITFKEGYRNVLGDTNWESKIESSGIGKSSGLEIIVRKSTGKITGLLSYVLSKSTRQFEQIIGCVYFMIVLFLIQFYSDLFHYFCYQKKIKLNPINLSKCSEIP